jgi:hypothetical protein
MQTHTASDEDDFASETWDLVEFRMLHDSEGWATPFENYLGLGWGGISLRRTEGVFFIDKCDGDTELVYVVLGRSIDCWREWSTQWEAAISAIIQVTYHLFI